MNRNFISRKLLWIVILLFLCSEGGFSHSFPEKNEVISIQISGYQLDVEVANTPQKRETGLMFRKTLGRNKGMLFVFPSEQFLTFWMKNTWIPLSIGYFKADGTLAQTMEMKPNQTTVLYPSDSQVKYALEVNEGWFEKRGITAGAQMVLPSTIPSQ